MSSVLGLERHGGALVPVDLRYRSPTRRRLCAIAHFQVSATATELSRSMIRCRHRSASPFHPRTSHTAILPPSPRCRRSRAAQRVLPSLPVPPVDLRQSRITIAEDHRILPRVVSHHSLRRIDVLHVGPDVFSEAAIRSLAPVGAHQVPITRSPPRSPTQSCRHSRECWGYIAVGGILFAVGCAVIIGTFTA